MVKGTHRSPPAPTTLDGEFIVFSFREDGRIDGAAFFRSPSADAFRGGQSRAFVSGSKTFHVYRVTRGEKDTLTFTRVEKPSGK